MTLIRECMLVLLLTTLTGGLLTMIWMAAVYAGVGKRNVGYVRWMLRAVLAGYLIPLVYLLAHRCIEFTRNDYAVISVSSAWMDNMLLALFVIWIVGAFLFLLSQLHIWICFRRIKKSSMVVPKEYLLILKALCSEMNIRKPISLYRGYGVHSPFIFGVRKPRIYLPLQEFSAEELEMILYHELIHYQQGDTFWKPVFGVLGNIYWFSPLSRCLWKEAIRWTEANCDFYCCSERFQAKKYFTLLLKMGSVDQSSLNNYAPMWTEGSRELKWRIKSMKKNKMKKTSGVVIAAILMVSLAGSGLTAHAATKGINEIYNDMYWSTTESVEEPLEQENELKEYEGTEADFEGTEIVEHTEDVNTRSIAGTILWPMTSNSTHCTAGFKAKAGGKITVSVGVNRDDKVVKVGIIKPDGSTSYVKGKSVISHTFSVSKSGTYRVFVQNLSSVKIQVQGSYFY